MLSDGEISSEKFTRFVLFSIFVELLWVIS